MNEEIEDLEEAIRTSEEYINDLKNKLGYCENRLERLYDKIHDLKVRQKMGEIEKNPIKLANLLERYGPNFLYKCKYYKTATKTLENGNLPAKVTYLGLVSFDKKTLEFEAYEAGSSIIFRVSVFDLDNFVL